MTVGWLLLLRLSHPMSRSALEAGPTDASAVDWPSVWDTDPRDRHHRATGTTGLLRVRVLAVCALWPCAPSGRVSRRLSHMTVGWLLLLRLSHPMSRSALEAGPTDASAVDWPSVWDTDPRDRHYHATGTTA